MAENAHAHGLLGGVMPQFRPPAGAGPISPRTKSPNFFCEKSAPPAGGMSRPSSTRALCSFAGCASSPPMCRLTNLAVMSWSEAPCTQKAEAIRIQ